MGITDKLKQLAELRKADEVLVYITSDTQPIELFAGQIARDAVSIFDKHLYKIGKKDKISLFLYSSGGELEAPWPIVSVLRGYCRQLEVIIPYKAFSAATLLSLGANKIVMTPLSFLSPIDPMGTFPVGQQNRQIQVEDVVGFIDFIKNRVGIAEQVSLAEAIKVLSSEIPPSVLGSINRTHALIRLLADKLLKLHKNSLEEQQLKVIVENLSEKLYSHQHMIGRDEARKLGFRRMIVNASSKEETLIRDIYQYYKSDMKLEEIINFKEILGEVNEIEYSHKRAVIESSIAEEAFVSKVKIQKLDPTLPRPYNIALIEQEWRQIPKPKKEKEEVKHAK